MSLSHGERKLPERRNSMCKVMEVNNIYRCVRKERIQSDYDLGPMVRVGTGQRAWRQIRKPGEDCW